jgi:hypothetical protein
VEEIGRILPSLLKKQILRAEPRLLEILIPLWPRIAGKTMARHSQPARFASGVLTLATDCATWGTQLRQMTEEIRAQINGFLGQALVRKLRIRTVTQPGLFSPAFDTGVGTQGSPRRPSPHSTSPAVQAEAVDTASIADPEVAATLASSYAKYFTRHRR